MYHLFARSKNGLLVQILSGLITYLLLAIYCHEQHKEPVSIRRVRQLRCQIRNEANQQSASEKTVPQHRKRKMKRRKQLKKSHAISALINGVKGSLPSGVDLLNHSKNFSISLGTSAERGASKWILGLS